MSVGGFYSFDGGLYLDAENTRNKEPIYVDLSITKGKAIDNHYSFICNQEAINPNVIKKPYFKKYNGGTLPLVSVLFDDYNTYTEYQWMTLLAVDSFYYGYYNKDGAFRDINIYWYDMLGITDYVIPILERSSADNFTKFTEQEGLNEQISVDEHGMLTCQKHIELPERRFELVQPIEKRYMPKWEAVVLYERQKENILVSSETYSDKYVLNMKVTEVNDNKMLKSLSA